MDLNQIYTLAVNVIIVMAFVLPIRFVLAKHLGVNAKSELDRSDNAAFGVAIGGGVLGLILMLTGVMSGEPMAVISEEIMSLVVYGVFGFILMIAGVLIQDRIVIRGISLSEEISKGNMAAAFIVAINMTVVGLVLKNAITWTDGDGLDGLVPIVVVFIASQVVLALVAFIRMTVYKLRNSKNTDNNVANSWQEAIASQNSAIALRYAGQVLATGILIATTSLIVDGDSLVSIALYWGGTAIALSLAVWLAYRLFLPMILFKVNVVEEVDQQGNVGVAAVEAALFVGLAFMASAYIL